MDFDKDGFLGEELKKWAQEYRAKYADYYLLCVELNRFFHDTMHKLNIHNKDPREILVSCLSIRAITTFQSAVLLSENGMNSQVKIIIRGLLDTLFRLVAISKSEEIANAYIMEDERHRKKFLNKFKRLNNGSRSDVDDKVLDELNEKLKKNIEERDIKELKTEWFAEKAGLSEFYNTAYGLFSSTVHTNVRDLEDYLILDEKGDVRNFRYDPEWGAIPSLLLTACECVFLCLRSISELFKVELDPKLQGLAENFMMLAEKAGWVKHQRQ